MVRTPEALRGELEGFGITGMRVAQILDSLKVGGAQKLQVTFAQAAAKSGDLDVFVVSLQESDPSPIPDRLRELGAEVMTLPSRKVLDPSRLRFLARWLRERARSVQHRSTPECE